MSSIRNLSYLAFSVLKTGLDSDRSDSWSLRTCYFQACPIFHQPFVGKRQQGVHVKCLSCCNDTALCNQDSGCKFPAAAGML